MRVWLVCALLAGLPSAARAQEVEDPDTESARRHFNSGLELYSQQQYAEAVREFEAAQALRPSPKLDYNIARCYDRLEEWAPAVEHYERYLPTITDDQEREQLKARLEILRKRIPPTQTTPQTPPQTTPQTSPQVAPQTAPQTSTTMVATTTPKRVPIYKRWWLWTVVG